MKSLELYDIITLNNEKEYTILRKIEYQGQNYDLIAPIDTEEEPDMENIKIVKEIIQGEKIIIEEETDEEKRKKISLKFLDSIKEDFLS